MGMGTITLAFLLCWWPYAVIFVRGTLMEGEEEKKTTGRLLYNMVIPAYLNSLINPLLYIALKEDVRDTLKNLILAGTWKWSDNPLGEQGRKIYYREREKRKF